jgi:hypothetical protein
LAEEIDMIARSPRLLLLAGSAVLLSGVTAAAQAQQSDDRSYFSRTVRFSGLIGERWEATEGSDFSATPADSYLLSQIRLNVNFQPISWLTFFGQAQDARTLFYGANPGTGVSDPFDLRQAWVAVGKREGNGFFAELGRQELTIGSGRLINATDTWWTNTARTFDVVHGSYTNALFRSEVVAGSVVQVDPNRIDRHKSGDHVYAEYNTFAHLIPGATVEPYFFARTLVGVKSKDGRLGDMDTLAAGGRVAGKVPGGVDYSFEALHEFGGYSSDRLNANGLAAGVGWTVVSSGWAPRISSDYAFASGDKGRIDGSRETFDNMYGSNQPLNSLTGLFGWKNICDWRAGVDFKPRKALKIKVDYRDYWLDSTKDGLYNASGARTVFNTKATSAHVGQGIEMQGAFSLSKNTLLGFGLGNLFAGAYLEQSHKTSGFIYPLVYLSQKF